MPISASRSPRGRAAARVVEWLPALVAAAYVVVVIVEFPALVGALYWDSDAAAAFVLGELAPGEGVVQIPRFGFWSSMWWLFATRDLPGHEHLWEVTGYAFALATAAIVGLATWRVAGRWAGMTAAAVTVVVGPRALTSLLTVNWHSSAPFTAVVLAAYLAVLARSRSWLLAVAIGVVAGVNTASDPLLWAAGVAPFAVGAGVLALAGRERAVAMRAAVVVGVAIVCALVTDLVMRSLDFHVIPIGLEPARLADLGSNVAAFGRSIALVFGASYFFRDTYPGDPLRYVVTLVAFAAVAATVLAAIRLTLRRAEPVARAYVCYWATAVVLLGFAYWGTNQAAASSPIGGLNYMLTYAPAAGASVAVLVARSSTGRVVVSLAVAFVGAVNVAGVAQGHAEQRVSARTNGPPLLRVLERDGLARGYAPLWDAHSLTWKSGMRLLVAPVQPCEPLRSRALCPNPFFTIESWYDERPGRSFLIVDPAASLATPPPRSYGPPMRTLRLDAGVTVYIYPYDLARHIRWRPHQLPATG